jgi:hypothetical protein
VPLFFLVPPAKLTSPKEAVLLDNDFDNFRS